MTGTAANDLLTTGDNINGGAGTDTLKVTVTGNTTPFVTLTNVENVEFTAVASTGALQANAWSGVSKISSVNSGVDGTTTATVTAQNLQNNVTVGLSNVAVQNANDNAIALTFASGKVGSNTATLAITANGVGSAARAADVAVTTAGTDAFTVVTVVTVDATGTTNNIGLEAGGAGQVAPTSVTLTGTGKATIAASTNVNFNNVTTVSSATNTGGLTIDVSTSTKDVTATGGAGADAFTLDLARNITVDTGAGDDVVTLANATAANLGTGDSIKGGDGTDVLAMTSAGAVAIAGDAAADLALVSGFERVRTTDDLNGSSFNISKISGANYLQIGATTTTGAATVSGFTSGATVEYRAAGSSTVAVNVGMTNATNAGTPDDTLTITNNSNLTAGATNMLRLGVDGINKLNVSTADQVNTDGATSVAGGEGYTLVLSNDSVVSTITGTGDRTLNYSASAAATGLTSIDLSAMTASTNVDLSAYTATQGAAVKTGAAASNVTGTGQGDIITGGAGADFLSGGAGTDNITGGAGNDYIDGGAGNDTMAGGAGNDTFVVTAVTTASAAGMAVDVITDLDFSNDKVLTTGTAPSAIANQTTNVDAKATVFDALNDTIASAIGANKAGTFSYKGDTYLFVNDGTAGLGAADYVAKVTGATGTLATTSFATAGLTFTGTGTITGTALADTLTGAATADTITGGAGADVINAGAGLDTVVVAASDTVLTIGGTGNAGTIAGFDVVSNLAAGTGTVNSETLNTVGTASVVANSTGANGNDSTLTISGSAVASHAITNGIVTFDDANTFLSALTIATAADVAAVVQYLQANDLGDAGATVAFDVGADTYVYTQGSDAGTDDTLDVLVQLVGVQATSLITTNATTANALFIA